MNNNLIEYKKHSIIQKIIDFFKNRFYKKQQKNMNNSNMVITKEYDNSDVINKNLESIKQNQKKQFLELYEKAKKDEIDLYSLDEETLRKLCLLIQEELKIVQKSNIIKKKKLKEIEEKIKNYQ